MTKYIIGEIFSSGGATLYKNPSDQTVKSYTLHIENKIKHEVAIKDFYYCIVNFIIAANNQIILDRINL
jgi:hypothetical protein